MRTITRRRALAGATANLILASPAAVSGAQANSAIAVGIIGTGGRGRFVGTQFAKDPRARIAALCDVAGEQIDRAKTQIPGADAARVYKDYRQLLAQPNLDAVLIATPVFLHPEHFEAAVEARKHIYCEKPAAADVAGVKRLLRAAQRADPSQHIVFGFQNRFSPEYQTALRLLSSGQAGELLLMECHFIRSGVPAKPVEPPYPAAEQRLRHWTVWRESSGDIIVEQDCHGLDVLNWFARAHPLRAIGSGGRIKRTFGDNLDHLAVTYGYPRGVQGTLVATHLTPPRYRDVREQFFCGAGVLETHRTYYKWQPADGEMVKVDSKREITIDAVEDFLAKVVANRPENTAPSGCDSTFTALLGRLAMDARREVTWEEMLQEG
jgi:predicted dehydrogenase